MAGKDIAMSHIIAALHAYEKGLTDLSVRTGVSEDRLRALSNGADPSMREVRALSGTLKISLADLAPQPTEYHRANVLFRGLAMRKRIPEETLTDTLSRKMGYSLELLQNRAGSMPFWKQEFLDLPEASPEAFAFHFRQLFCGGDQVSPLFSLPLLLVNGLNIMVFVVNSAHLEGASAFLGGVPFIFVASRFSARMLFTCAHELGHLLAHHDPEKDFAVIDSSAETSSDSATSAERFAHAFASALLIPRAGVGIALKKIRAIAKVPDESPIGDIELLYLARIFGVSFEAAARRCEDLHLVPRGASASLNEKVKEQHGSAEKKADALGLPPRATIVFPPLPRTLLSSVVQKIRNGELSIGRASMMLGLSVADLLAANTSQ